MEPLQLHLIHDFVYCPRRCYLRAVTGIATINHLMVEGTEAHERVDSTFPRYDVDGRYEYALPIWSDHESLVGICDAVFFGSEQMNPIEHKHSVKGRNDFDKIQAVAQSFCLSEMFGKDIQKAGIFYRRSKKMVWISIRASDYLWLRKVCQETRKILATDLIPRPTKDRYRCKSCSVINICLPGLSRR
jgi:CRISPR-associated exonuclease Cas4